METKLEKRMRICPYESKDQTSKCEIEVERMSTHALNTKSALKKYLIAIQLSIKRFFGLVK